MTIPDVVRSACEGPIDYSEQFTARVREIAKTLSGTLGLKVSHDADMNYRAGQSLSMVLQVDPPTGRGKAAIEVRIYISSRAKVFAFYCFDINRKFVGPKERNHPVSPARLPEGPRQVIEKCRKLLREMGYQEVPQEIFDEKAPGCVTELDGLPTTVFSALFAEVV
jgi:hypothetical protein